MKRFGSVILLACVALCAALIGHVVIDVLGDFLLAHDTYDDLDHSSRRIVALVALALAGLGAGYGLRAAIREARGSEDAFCHALRSALPRREVPFIIAAIAASTLVLCVMEGCDALLAGKALDDLGDLFGGSLSLGATVNAGSAMVLAVFTLRLVRRLSRTRIVAGVVGAFLQRNVACVRVGETDFDRVTRLIFHAHHTCRRIAGRAPPLFFFAATS